MERDSLNVVSDQAGTPTYARDLAYVIAEILSKIRIDKQYAEIYHFSNEGIYSWYDFACAIMEMSKLNSKVIPVETHEYPTPAGRPAYADAIITKPFTGYQRAPIWLCLFIRLKGLHQKPM